MGGGDCHLLLHSTADETNDDVLLENAIVRKRLFPAFKDVDVRDSSSFKQPSPERPEIGTIAKTARHDRNNFALIFYKCDGQREKRCVEVAGFNTNLTKRLPMDGMRSDFFVRWIEDCVRKRPVTKGERECSILDKISRRQVCGDTSMRNTASGFHLAEMVREISSKKRVDLET